jgi:hypothetical protein
LALRLSDGPLLLILIFCGLVCMLVVPFVVWPRRLDDYVMLFKYEWL